METLELRKPIVHTKTQLRVGNWNVRTLYAPGKAAQAAKAMRENKLQIMGREVHSQYRRDNSVRW